MTAGAEMTDNALPKPAVEFGCFDPDAETEITARNLPHWFQPGAAMFVTFRTADSMPREVIVRWRRELEAWLAARQLPVKLANSMVDRRLSDHEQLMSQLNPAERQEFKRLSDRIYHRSLDDCHGACLLKRSDLAAIVSEAILFHLDSKYDLDRFIVMPNHVHAIVQFRQGANLDLVSQSWMRFTARRINNFIEESGPFWQPEPFDHIIRSAEQFEYLQRYTAENPKKARLKSGEFLYWERE